MPIKNIEEKPPDIYYKSVKVSLKHILKHNDINQPKINRVVIKAHKIVIHTLQFIKLYLLDHYQTHNSLPIIDEKFINSCMKILCISKNVGRPPKEETKTLKDKLKYFYDKHYKHLRQNEQLDYTHMNAILNYLTTDILTMYENNIKQHYVEYVERYVNIVWRKKEIVRLIRKVKKTKRERITSIYKLCSQLRKIKNDLLNVSDNEYGSNKIYHKWISEQKKNIIPNKSSFQKDNLFYDLQCCPQDYLIPMIHMMKEIESSEYSIYNVFPLRNEIIPKHIRIDTTTLVHVLMTKKQGNKNFYLTNGNLKKYQHAIWKFFFRTERRCFKKTDYSFHHMISTDGVSCSIIFLRSDKVGKKIIQDKIPRPEKYIDELEDYSKLQDKRIVAIDPNLSDLLYCVDSDERDRNFYRYTQNQRRKETKQKKYQKILLDFKKSKIGTQTIIELETEISLFNRKTLIIDDYKKYLATKNEINHILFNFYEGYIFRKLKLNGCWNRMRTEQRLINRFQKIFGSGSETIVCIGDFEQKKHRKFKEPLKGKGFRNLFRKNGYQVYLVDEFRTSCKCSNCGGDCEKFRKCRNPKPNKNDTILVHGVVMCKTCSALWNRDENASRNIYKISYNAINDKERPKYLDRSKDCKAVISGATSVCGLQHNSS